MKRKKFRNTKKFLAPARTVRGNQDRGNHVKPNKERVAKSVKCY